MEAGYLATEVLFWVLTLSGLLVALHSIWKFRKGWG